MIETTQARRNRLCVFGLLRTINVIYPSKLSAYWVYGVRRMEATCAGETWRPWVCLGVKGVRYWRVANLEQLDAFPLLREYMRELPDGWDSYPECRVRTEVFDPARQVLARHVDLDRIPDPVAAWVREKSDDWISEVIGCSVHLLLRDTVFDNDDKLLGWVREEAMKTYDKPMFRVLMRVMSPSLLVMGTAKRWRLFHSGRTALKAGKIQKISSRSQLPLRLTYPAHLFPPALLGRFAVSMEAALQSSNAKEPEVKFNIVSSEECAYQATWR